MNDYFSCELKFNEDKSKVWVGQPYLIKKMEKKFGKLIGKNMGTLKTPGTPGMSNMKPRMDDDVVNNEMQMLFRSGTGMLLYLVKHSRPDITNSVRELTRLNHLMR